MKNIHINHQVLVGIFISAGMSILIAAIYFLGGQQKRFVRSIAVSAVFKDINGLQPGNNVWLLGMKVGTVKSVSFYGKEDVRIIMTIETAAQNHIHKDALAKISSDGFIGNKIIVLTGGSPDAKLLEEGDYLHTETLVSTDVMLGTLEENNKNLLEITRNIKTVSYGLAGGKGTLGTLLNDPAMASDLKETLSHFKNVSAKSELVIDDLQKFSNQLHKKGTLTKELVSDTIVFQNIRMLVSNLKSASAKLDNSAGRIYEISDSLHNISAALSDTRKPIGMLLNDKEVAHQLREIIKNLQSGSQKLDDDLEAAQHNVLLRGYFQKKEKTSKPK